jgi:(Z)-2-((N-methylformamido)methylene)-5-hydroxybutyrolactone dehydrogenase
MSQVKEYQLFIDNKFVSSADGRFFDTSNPFTGETWAKIPRAQKEDVDRAIAAAKSGYKKWRDVLPTQRGKILNNLAQLIEKNAVRLGEIECRDNGKLIAEVSAQMKYCAEYYRYYGGLADKVQGAVIPSDRKGVFAYSKYEPKGVVAVITPWNSPLNLTAWKLAPALAAGCAAVLKPSEFTSASTLELMTLIEEAGFPPGVVNAVTGFGAEVGDALVRHPDIAHVSFTGGEMSGIKVYEAAASQLKTVTLELGGKSPNIVFDDADIDQAVKGAVSGIFAASGQTCIAGSRLLLQRGIHDEFVAKLIDFMKDVRIGDPSDPSTQIGPICTTPQFDKIMSHIESAKQEGAKCVMGGKSRTIAGCSQFVEPTIFTDVKNSMKLAQEEIFGPVLAIIPFDTEEEAIEIGNDIRFGLAAGVWTRSLRRARMMADRLEAGTIWINNYRATSFTSPFGGFKRSGIGRESGVDAIKEYLETKCVLESSDLEVPNPFIRR